MAHASRARVAVTTVFFLNGIVFASWYSRLPSIQEQLDLGPGTLGLALIGAPVGLLAAQPLTGALAATIGSRRLVAASPLTRSSYHAGDDFKKMQANRAAKLAREGANAPA